MSYSRVVMVGLFVFVAAAFFGVGTVGADQDWEKVVAMARKEGQVTVAGGPGRSHRAVTEGFQKRFPKIRLDYTGFRPSALGSRVMSERKAGRKLWDVYVGGANPAVTIFSPGGVFADIRSSIIQPDVKNDKTWYGGLAYGYIDNGRKYVFGFVGNTTTPVRVNRAFLPASEFNKVSQLIDPKFKGKIVIDDPRKPGIGSAHMASLLASYGEDFMRKLLTGQEAVFMRNPRQLTEWVVRGRYPIGIGLRVSMLSIFRKQGLGKEVESMSPERVVWSTSSGNLALFEGAPHPNAATVFINWILSREAQEAWAKKTGQNSRRVDVAVVDKVTFPDPKKLKDYKIRNDEKMKSTVERAVVRLAKELIK